jgi:glucose-6-phosphate isomerase
MWDWVGGRYSVWSAIGLPIALRYGFAVFAQFLAGAHDMDAHFRTSPLARCLPFVLAASEIWNLHFQGADSHVVLCYDHRLKKLPDFLQQLEMESNGKHILIDGEAVRHHTAPIVWGGEGTNGQHSFHQLLHQGTHLVPVDFVIAAGGGRERDPLAANALAQAAALMTGHSGDGNPHQDHPGNRPSGILLLERLSPEALGQLLALYEHKVFIEGVIWNINSFDQWGVELGKSLARALLPAFQGDAPPDGTDPATRAMIERIRRARPD